jgi:trans-2,3-dihydro-3-hydroxyanthranilate isomerase
MQRRFVTADVFTSSAFSGNPVAVVLDADGLTTGQMQAIAREFNYSETTFVLPAVSAQTTARVRIFTPRIEVPFAGHPNVGTAVVLARHWEAAGRRAGDHFVFDERAGLVAIRLLREHGAVVGAELVAPEKLSLRETMDVEAAAACLSLEPQEVRTATHPPQIASVGLPFLIVELESRPALSRAKPDIEAHEKTLLPFGIDAVYAYVVDSDAGDLHARTFAPLDGCIEDPATGSATGAAIALVTQLTGQPTETREWRVHQGVDMGRPSLILGRVEKRDGIITGVRIGGRAVAVLEGILQLAGS